MDNQVYYEKSDGTCLCFNHAVKAVMEKDETIYAYAEAETSGYSVIGGASGVCRECFPEEEVKEDDEGRTDNKVD